MGGIYNIHLQAASNDFPFSDLDLIFNITLTDETSSSVFDRIRDAVLDALSSLLPSTTCKDKVACTVCVS